MDQTPTVGRIVHYQSYGTPGGEYRSEPRAAIITAVNGGPLGDYRVSLCVLNPEGMYFNRDVPYEADDFSEGGLPPKGGTWHWPTRV